MAISLLRIAGSGLAAQSTRLQVSAHNTANLNTRDFTPQRVALQEAPGGVSAIVESDPTPDVDLTTEVATQLSAARAYEANLAVLQAGVEQLDTLLDVVG